MSGAIKIFAAMTMCLLVVACNDDKDNHFGITFDADCNMAPIFNSDGDTMMYGFTTNDNWCAAVQDDWVSVYPTSGSAKDKLFSISVAPSESIEPRSTVLTVYLSHGTQVKIPITQEQKPYAENLGSEIYTIGAEGGTLSIDIAINMDYVISVPKTDFWITAEKTRTMNDGNIRVCVDRSGLSMSRMTHINILTLDNRIIDSLPIIQDAYTQAQNEICYTTTAHQKTDIENLKNFNTNILAHFYDKRTDMCRIVFEGQLRGIPSETFKDKSEITSFILPSTIHTIRDRVFEGCSGCRQFTIPANLTDIGGGVFNGCSGNLIMECSIPNATGSCSDEQHWLYGSNFSDVTLHGNIGKYAFCDYSNLKSVTLGDGVHIIQNNAFKGCENIESVHIGDVEQWYAMSFGNESANPLHNSTTLLWADGTLVTKVATTTSTPTVGRYTFYNYKVINSINICNATTSIGWGAFGNCEVEDIYLGTGIISMGASVFDNCKAERMTINFNFPGHSFDVNNAMHWFKGLHVKSVTFDNDVTTIGDFVLSSSYVEHITIGNNVEYIGQGAFAECQSLESVTVGDALTTIDQHAFFRCKKLNNILLNDSLQRIEAYAFNSCETISSITIPASVSYIGDYAFSGCSNLTSIYLQGTTPPELGNSYVFDKEQSNLKIYVPAEAYDSYKSSNNWSRFQSAMIPYSIE